MKKYRSVIWMLVVMIIVAMFVPTNVFAAGEARPNLWPKKDSLDCQSIFVAIQNDRDVSFPYQAEVWANGAMVHSDSGNVESGQWAGISWNLPANFVGDVSAYVEITGQDSHKKMDTLNCAPPETATPTPTPTTTPPTEELKCEELGVTKTTVTEELVDGKWFIRTTTVSYDKYDPEVPCAISFDLVPKAATETPVAPPTEEEPPVVVVTPTAATPEPTPAPKYEDERPYCVIPGSESWDLNGVGVVIPSGGMLKKRLDDEPSYPGLWEVSNLPERYDGQVYLTNGMDLIKKGQECSLKAQAEPTPEPQVASVRFNTGLPDLNPSAANATVTGSVEIPELGLSFRKYNATPVNNWVNPVGGMVAMYNGAAAVHINDLEYSNLDGLTWVEDGQSYVLHYVGTYAFGEVTGSGLVVTCSATLDHNVVYSKEPLQQ